MVVIPPDVQARRGRHASRYVTRIGSPAFESSGDFRAPSFAGQPSPTRCAPSLPCECSPKQRAAVRLLASPWRALNKPSFCDGSLVTHVRMPPGVRRCPRARVAVCALPSPVCCSHGASRRARWSGAWITGRWWHSSASLVVALTWTVPFCGSPRTNSVRMACQKFEVSRCCKINFTPPKKRRFLLLC
jgi:hypothetical protein